MCNLTCPIKDAHFLKRQAQGKNGIGKGRTKTVKMLRQRRARPIPFESNRDRAANQERRKPASRLLPPDSKCRKGNDAPTFDKIRIVEDEFHDRARGSRCRRPDSPRNSRQCRVAGNRRNREPLRCPPPPPAG